MVSRAGGRTPQSTRSLPLYEAGAIDVPFVIQGMREHLAEDTRWEAHSHPTHELLWNRRGASTATVGSRVWTITPSVGVWLPAGTIHSAAAPAGTWYCAAQFGPHATPSIAAEPVAVEMSPLLILLLERLQTPDLGPGSRALTEATILDVLRPAKRGLLVRFPESSLLRPIVDAMRENPADATSLAEWATRVGASERTLTRAFRSETGLGFLRWQMSVRVQRAMALLSSERGDAPGSLLDVAEIAETLGYRSSSAFGSAFRKVTGQTPGEFRRLNGTGLGASEAESLERDLSESR